MTTVRRTPKILLTLSAMAFASGALAYTGTECKEDGNCGQPKPGYPEVIAGTKYDPKHDPNELA